MTLVKGMLHCERNTRFAKCARQGGGRAPQLAALEPLGVRQVLDVEGPIDNIVRVRVIHPARQGD